MAKTMKALVKAKREVGLWMQDVPVPEIGPNDVLVKIRKTAICAWWPRPARKPASAQRAVSGLAEPSWIGQGPQSCLAEL